MYDDETSASSEYKDENNAQPEEAHEMETEQTGETQPNPAQSNSAQASGEMPKSVFDDMYGENNNSGDSGSAEGGRAPAQVDDGYDSPPQQHGQSYSEDGDQPPQANDAHGSEPAPAGEASDNVSPQVSGAVGEHDERTHADTDNAPHEAEQIQSDAQRMESAGGDSEGQNPSETL